MCGYSRGFLGVSVSNDSGLSATAIFVVFWWLLLRKLWRYGQRYYTCRLSTAFSGPKCMNLNEREQLHVCHVKFCFACRCVCEIFGASTRVSYTDRLAHACRGGVASRRPFQHRAPVSSETDTLHIRIGCAKKHVRCSLRRQLCFVKFPSDIVTYLTAKQILVSLNFKFVHTYIYSFCLLLPLRWR